MNLKYMHNFIFNSTHFVLKTEPQRLLTKYLALISEIMAR